MDVSVSDFNVQERKENRGIRGRKDDHDNRQDYATLTEEDKSRMLDHVLVLDWYALGLG